jgi:hypothetical protein
MRAIGHHIARRADWTARLNAAIAAAEHEPFGWGVHDCALFAADVVCAMTGFDYAAPYRGKYHSAPGAARILARNGGLAGILDTLFDEVSPAKAQRGDVVLWESETGPALGVVTGFTAAAAGPTGRVAVPMRLWLRAWRV